MSNQLHNSLINTGAGALFEKMREEKANNSVQSSPSASSAKKFASLPDGDYVGRVYISVNAVSTPDSPNYGREKYEIKLTVTEGDHKGKLAYHNRVIVPHQFAQEPNESQIEEYEQWRVGLTKHLKTSDRILGKCGVDTSDRDATRYALRIGENNRRNRIVNFHIQNGVCYINGLVETDDSADELFKDLSLPDGNDAPL